MLNFTLKGTYQDGDRFNWDYYGDDADPNTFYIVPRPQFVMLDGKPSFQITRYETGGSDSGDGFCRFDVELAVPSAVEDAIKAQIPQRFPHATSPAFLTPAYNQGGKAYFDFESGATKTTFSAPVSAFGSNVASFLLPMTKTQLDTISAAFSTSGGAYEIRYHVSVPARLPAVTAVLSFDSGIAFQYQVTQPQYDSWGDETSPGSVKELLNASASSKVTITWGSSQPSADLRQAVADWANDTLADLVSAEVEKVVALQGIKSGESLNISEVSSFTSTYSENMVIDWILSPSAVLPSFPSLGLQIADFTASVNERQQQMTVMAFLPFTATGGSTPKGGGTAVVDHVSVTVSYPGLPESAASHTFTTNDARTFVAPYDSAAGPTWSLAYTVTYTDKAMPVVNGEAKGIDAGSYTLQVEEAGLLSVLFDASQAFASEGTRPEEIDISLVFSNSDGSSELITQSIKIFATDATHQKTITSYLPVPLNSPYNYQVTYVFAGSETYTAPLAQNETGFNQVVPAANAMHSCNLIVFVPAAAVSQDEIFDATVQVWYQQPPTLPPGVGTQPTKDSPAVFTVTPAADAKSNLFGRETFVGLLSGDQPLVYSASIDAANGQVDILEALVENDIPSIMVTLAQRYFTLAISPAAIDWSSATFQSVEVQVTASVAQGTATSPPASQPPQREYTWNRGETGSKFVTYAIQEGNQVTYDWQASYVTAGHPVQSRAATKDTDLTLNIPAGPG